MSETHRISMLTAIVAGLLGLSSTSNAQTEPVTMTCKVVEVQATTVKLSIPPNGLPKVGDRFRIVFSIPNIDDVAVVAEGRITAVGNDAITGSIEKHTGNVQANQLAHIDSYPLPPRNQMAQPQPAVRVTGTPYRSEGCGNSDHG